MSEAKHEGTAKEKRAPAPDAQKLDAPSTTDWASEAVDRARSEADMKAQKRTAKAEPSKNGGAGEPNHSQPAPVGRERSLRESLLAITKDTPNVASLKRTLDDAKDLAGSQELVDRFIALMESADALAEYKLGMQDIESDTNWSGMTWRQKEEQLRNWAEEGDDQAQILVTELDKFLAVNAPYRLFLCELVDQFIGPLGKIANLSGLKRFLDGACENGWVNCFRNPHWVESDGVEISWGPKQRSVYIPMKTPDRKEKPRIARAWPYIKKRLEKVREAQEGLDNLRYQATAGLTPAKISHEEEGFLFVQTGAISAVLLEAISEGAHGMVVRVAGSFGCDENRLPSDCQLWDKKTHRPAQGNVGKWAFITRSLDYQVQRKESLARERKESRDKRISLLTDGATFGTRFEDQGLTSILIKGEQGSAAFWNPKFRWNQRERFFGARISHDGNGMFVLEAVVSDFQFPQELIGQKLPLAVNAEKSEVELEANLPSMKSELYQALKMARMAINSRLGAEKRFSGKSSEDETAPEEADKSGD